MDEETRRGAVTSGTLNPTRTLGPMIVAGQFTVAWVYVLGPIICAVLAALPGHRGRSGRRRA